MRVGKFRVIFRGLKWGGYVMKKSIILILILVACIFTFNHFAQNNRNELSELGTLVQNLKLEYKMREDLATTGLIFIPFL